MGRFCAGRVLPVSGKLDLVQLPGCDKLTLILIKNTDAVANVVATGAVSQPQISTFRFGLLWSNRNQTSTSPFTTRVVVQRIYLDNSTIPFSFLYYQETCDANGHF